MRTPPTTGEMADVVKGGCHEFVSPEAVVGTAVYTAWPTLHGNGGDLLGDARGEHRLMPSDETEIVRPEFREDNDNV